MRTDATSLGGPFRRLWTATATANVADGILLVGFPLLAVDLTRSPWQVSLVSALATAPRLVVSLHAGAIADRLDRRLIMLTATAVRVCVLAALTVSTLIGGVGLVGLYVVVVLLGLGEVVADTAAQSMIPMVVGRADLGIANGRLVAAQTVANDFLGGPIAGVLAGVGAAAVAGVPAAIYLGATLLLTRLPGVHRPRRHDDTTMGADILEGLRHVTTHPVLRALAVLVSLLNLAGAAYLAVFVLWAVGADAALGMRASTYGLLMAALAVGGAAGAVSTERLSRRVGEPVLLRSSAGVLAPLFLLPVWVPAPAVAAGAFVVIGLAAAIHKVLVASITQRLVPDDLLGRVNATMRLLGLGTMPLGAALGGALGSLAGLVPVFHLTAGLCLAGVVVIWPAAVTPTTDVRERGA